MIFGVDGQPPLPKPTIAAAVGTPAHKDLKDHLERWNRVSRRLVSTWMWDRRYDLAASREECEGTVVCNQSTAYAKHPWTEGTSKNEMDGIQAGSRDDSLIIHLQIQ